MVAGKPLPKEYSGEDLEVLGKGCANVAHHVACLSQKFNVRVVVAVNKFATDTPNELQLVREAGIRAGAHYAVVADHWAQGGHGAVDLGEAVIKACAAESTPFRYLYPLSDPVRSKIEAVCSKIYLAGEVTYSELAASQIDAYEAQGLGNLPICVAKTQYSPVWKSARVSGASLSHFSAMTRPCWLRRAVRNRHRHAIEQASRRWRGGDANAP